MGKFKNFSDEDQSLLGEDYQQRILKLMLTDLTFAVKASSFLREGFLNADYRWFFREISRYVETHKACPPLSYLQEQILRHDITSRNVYGQKLEQISKINIHYENKEDDAIKEYMTNFAKMHLFVANLQEMAELYNKRNVNGAFQKMHSFNDEFRKVTFEDDATITIDDWEKEVKANQENYANACFLGIKVMDHSLGSEGGGGLLPQTWTTFIGASNAGKSMLAPTLSFVNALRCKKIFVTVHEDEEKPTKARFLAAFSGVSINRLNIHPDHLSSDERESLDLAEKMLTEHVRIRFMYGKEATIERVQEVLRVTQKEWPFDLYICDYGQCLTTTAFKHRDNDYQIMGYVYEQLKQICCELNIAGCGGAQATRSANLVNKKGTDFLRTTDVSDCFTIIKKSSNVITINRSDDAVETNRIHFLLDKARSGRCPVAIECVSDYSKARSFYEDGIETMYIGNQGDKKNVLLFKTVVQKELRVSDGIPKEQDDKDA